MYPLYICCVQYLLNTEYEKKIILILIFLPLTLLGQHLKCCESKKEVETYLSGTWKQNDSKPDFLYKYKNDREIKTNVEIFYKYTFEKGQGHLMEMIRRDKKDGYQILDDHPFVEIIKYDQGFKLKFTDLSGSTISKLKYLNSNRMILVTNGKEVELIKESE